MEERLDRLIALTERIVELLEGNGSKKPQILAPSHLWLTYGEVVALGVSGKTVTKKIKNRVWEGRDSGRRARNGKTLWEIKFTSLPEKLRTNWLQDKELVKTV